MKGAIKRDNRCCSHMAIVEGSVGCHTLAVRRLYPETHPWIMGELKVSSVERVSNEVSGGQILLYSILIPPSLTNVTDLCSVGGGGEVGGTGALIARKKEIERVKLSSGINDRVPRSCRWT